MSDDTPTIMHEPERNRRPFSMGRLQAKRSDLRSWNYASGVVYLLGAVAIYLGASSGTFNSLVTQAAERLANRPLPANPISRALNLEGRVGDNADNLVRLTSAGGVGTGQITDPYTIYTAHHVVDDAFKNGNPVYIQSQTYLHEDESLRVDLNSGNYRFNPKSDIGVITLDTPFFQAHTIQIDKKYNFDRSPDGSSRRVRAVCYRNKELDNMKGKVEMVLQNAPRFYKTDIKGGPGNSGCAVFNSRGHMVGVTSMAFIPSQGFKGNLDVGKLIFSDVGNML